MRHKEK
jgi:hypothetical protein